MSDATPANPPVKFAASILLADELALHLMLDYLSTHQDFANHFITEADKLLEKRLPTPQAHEAFKTLRDQVKSVSSLHRNQGSRTPT